jgi:sirohydrochlorin cobaltochelatase
MGHGNPEGYDYYGGNVRYLQLENYLRAINQNYFVGTVDMEDTYVDNVLEHVAGGNFDIAVGDVTVTMSYATNTAKKGQLYPLMSIAGDHAHNDMAGEGAEYWDEEDPESEDNSWFEYFKNNGYESIVSMPAGNKHPQGLLELPGILNVWIQHTKNAEFLEDAYHSMYPEE